jgi:membrane associated rhomboid family serine protease
MFGNVGNLHMANFAHLGGLVSGVLLGIISEQVRG